MAVDLAYAIGLQPEKAIAYFESKGYKIGFRWQDVAAETHARAFTVAGVMKVDVLQDIRQALAKSLEKGTTFDDFKRQISPVLERKGWLGKGMIVDQDTGEIEGKRLTPRRLETIFQTNMQSAYMAGRYATQLEQVGTHPYWEYVAILDSRTRPAHRALAGSVYRYDDPFWQTFYPPNGYRCRCRVRTRTQGYVDRNDVAVRSSAGQLEEVEQPVGRDGQTQPAIAYKDPVTGRKLLPDPGFGSNPGAQWMKPFTPPPMDTLPQSTPNGVEMPAPKPHPVAPGDYMGAFQTPEQYASMFMKRFGAAIGKPTTYTDVIGEQLQVNEWMFKDGAGRWAKNLEQHGPYVGLVADAIQNPDEIWLSWELINDAWELRRRYLRVVESERGVWGLSVFETGQEGWTSTTFFVRSKMSGDAQREFMNHHRGTFLRYQRPSQGE
ncbi:phage minor head protein [Burkholderia arboris]|uniref:phage minor head protein n=1 Tax=Burkholderia arboris TaxID=488730 RepID=UPI001589A671|nr:phage minor head protein [Burkholderia arboris]